MHFISEHAVKKLVRAHKDLYSQASGEKIGVEGSVWIQMERGCPKWAVDTALEHFSMANTPQGESGTRIPVQAWIAYVDTNEWQSRYGYTDELRKRAEALLSQAPDVLPIEPPQSLAPWPAYDKVTVQGRRDGRMVAAQLLETAREIGVSIDDMLIYERATRNHPDVVAAFEEASGRQADEREAGDLISA